MKVKDAKLRDENFSAPKIGIGTKFYVDSYDHDTDDIYMIVECNILYNTVGVINMQTGQRAGDTVIDAVNPRYLSLSELSELMGDLDIDRLEVVDVAIKLVELK